MPTIAIVADSTADLTDTERADLGVAMVPLNVHFGSTVYRDYIDISPGAFLSELERSRDYPRTSQPSPHSFSEAINSALDGADEVIVLTLSSKLSGTHGSAVLGARESSAPERVQVYDSLSASIGLGMQVRRAVDLARTGGSAQEIVQTLTREREAYHLLFFADTLEYLHRGGRIGKASQMVGSILKIKPLLLCKDGEVVPLERTRNRSRAIEGLIDYARRFERADALSILHDGSDTDDVERIKADLTTVFPPEQVIVSVYGPIIATHVGSGAVGLCLRAASAQT